MSTLKIVGVALLLLVVTLAGGWVWGRSGRAELESSLAAAELRLALVDARLAVQDARVSLYNINFGEASQHLELAKAPLARALERLRAAGDLESAALLTAANGRVAEAQRLAGSLDQGANTEAAEAARAIGRVLEGTGAQVLKSSRRPERVKAPARSRLDSGPGAVAHRSVVALTSTDTFRSPTGSADCDAVSGLPLSRITVSDSRT